MDEKQRLVKAYGEVTGRLPINLNQVLNVLKHPDVIAHTKAYLQIHDHTDTCQKYQAPWNCAMESEAVAETIQSGWADERPDHALYIREIMENWCVNCRARLFGEDPGDIDRPLGSHWLEDAPDEEVDNPFLADCD